MKSTVTDLGDAKVKVLVEVDEDTLATHIDATYRKIAQEVRVPGFRPGKAPRKILEARLGPGVARGEALQEAISESYSEAVRDHLVDVIAPPEIEVTAGQEEGALTYEALVEVRPRIEIAGYEGLRVEIPSPVASGDEIQEQIDRFYRVPFAELVAVDRSAVDGDHVLMDITGSEDGEELAGLTAQDYSYEVGIEALVVELDENLRGAKAGDILEFDADHPAQPDRTLDFRVLVKEVREQRLPELTDEWVNENTEFDTAEALRGETSERLARVKRGQAASALRQRVGEAIVALVDEDPPAALVDHTAQESLQELVMQLSAQGIELSQWLSATGRSVEDFQAEMTEGAAGTARLDLALRAIAVAEGLEPDDEEIETELGEMAEQVGSDLESVRERLATYDGLMGLRSDMTKRAAMQWVTERAILVEEDTGDEIDRSLLDEPETDDDETDNTGIAAADADNDEPAADTSEETE